MFKGKMHAGGLGEVNVLKTGFYAKAFRKREIRDLAEAGDMGEEIQALRVLSRRLLEAVAGCKDPEVLRETLRALATAAGQVGALMRLQKSLGQNGFDELVDKLLMEINDEWAK